MSSFPDFLSSSISSKESAGKLIPKNLLSVGFAAPSKNSLENTNFCFGVLVIFRIYKKLPVIFINEKADQRDLLMKGTYFQYNPLTKYLQ